MATIPVGVRLEQALVERLDAIAEETGVSRTEVIERCIRLGLKQEEEFVELGPVAMELMNVLLSDPVRKPLEKLLGPANAKQVERFRHMRDKRRTKPKPATE
jgi:metal-responsive CopG/Arc/MetJ family transcriptional regulator